MKSLATVVGYVAWFVSQFIGTALLVLLMRDREHLRGQELFEVFIVHSILWVSCRSGISTCD